MTNLLTGLPTGTQTYGVNPQADAFGSFNRVQQQPSAPAAAASVSVGDSLSGSQSDVIELNQNTGKKKGPVKKLKGFIGGIKKTLATAGTYITGGAKGIGKAIVGGSVIYTSGKIINTVKTNSAIKTAVKTMAEGADKAKVMEEAAKSVKKLPNKAAAAIFAAGAIALSLWNASLDATGKRSEIEHRWIGHQN